MVVVRKVAAGRVHYRALDAVLDGGDTTDVSEGMADYLTERGDFERVSDAETGGSDAEDGATDASEDEPPFDPGEHTVDELRTAMDTDTGESDYSETEREALAAAERDGKNRDTAIDVLEG